jgi:transcriptional regulator with XRE-family HTH domain
MKKRALGPLIRKSRESLDMTQRELADAIGVKASHIAYIETGQRRPSLSLLRRIADTLGLNPRELLFLSHPDAEHLVGLPERQPSPRNDAWRRFVSNRALLRRHKITRKELGLLRQVSLLEHVTYPEHFLFILNSIRQAGVPGRTA